jgi:hypothetical protein
MIFHPVSRCRVPGVHSTIIQTLKGQLGIEHPGAHEPSGLFARVVQRILALNAAVWHNWTAGEPIKRSLTPYDHCPAT